MTALTITRRSALAAGIAMASLGDTMASGTEGALPAARPIDVLMVDDGVTLPLMLAAFVAARRRTLPVAAIRLDAPGHAALNRRLASSACILGLSSGATLFCVERIAWDHGFRLIGRDQRCTVDLHSAACAEDVLALLYGAQPFAPRAASLARTYRPSRDDDMLHVWAMRKALARREGRS